jgi:transcriptional regulator with XRE-family HTH domain
MTSREAFGPNLRRRRMREGITLEDLARHTRVSVELWDAMERNDFSRWPFGIQARAFVREYAVAIGVDPCETVNDFCRLFPQGDRRTKPLLRGAAALVGHALEWQDELPPHVPVDRRRRAVPLPADPTDGENPDDRLLSRVSRVRIAAAVMDVIVIVTTARVVARFLPLGQWPALAIAALLYHGISQIFAGCTPATWAIETDFRTQRYLARLGQHPTFRRLVWFRGRRRAPQPPSDRLAAGL